jgi:hypothetical protein
MKVEINSLQTVKNYAVERGFTPSYIYKLVREGKMQSIEIDGVYFIDKIKFPGIPKSK